MRMPGLATGLDVDSIVKSTMKPHQIRVDQTIQKKDVLEIKQKLYRDILSDSKKFYDKNLDILKPDTLLKPSSYKSVEFTSSNEDAVTVKGDSTAKPGDYTVSGTKATAAKAVITAGITAGTTLNIQGKDFKLKGSNQLEIAKDLNERLKELGITARYSQFGNTTGAVANVSALILESTTLGKAGNFNTTSTTVTDGVDANIIIKDNKGGVYTHEGNTNTVTLDGITFNVTGDIPAGGVNIKGKKDVTELKDKVVKFVNDYNTLMEKLNTTTITRHDRSYSPLTAEQKKDMSESEVKLWNEKVETGQLNRDSDITRIANSMKETMRTVMEGTGFNLQKMGVFPVKDYSGNRNGTFAIDEDKLKTALEDNTEDVMKLFTTSYPTDDELTKLTSEEKAKRKDQTGILYKLKNTFDNEIRSSTSALAKKVGIEGTASFANNELTKSISTYEEKIKQMKKDLTRREQHLYSKYATLETMMNKYNSQQSYLSSQMGQ